MHRSYDIFEVLPSGSLQRVTVAFGLEFAKVELERTARRTSNECFASDAKTRQVVMQRNVTPVKLLRICQIAYDEGEGLRRAETLRSRGYAVISVIGNEAAKVVLSSPEPYGLFIVGVAATQDIKTDMVEWLQVRYPKVKILSLNPADQQVLGADDNVWETGPENWLRIVQQQLGNSGESAASRKSAANGV